MLVSLEWLQDFLKLDGLSTLEIAERLSRTGLEVEGVENMGQDLNNLVVGYVEIMEAHPDSDHLKVTQVNDGSGDLRQIVCGAPNIAQGQKVIVALPGAVLPGNFEIKESEIRGVSSRGMICSLQEIGFSDSVVAKEYAKGIFVLPEDAPVGADVVEYLKLDDGILDIDITPNRADALSILGNAYELAAIFDEEPSIQLLDIETQADQSLLDTVSVEVAAEDIAPAYQLRIIKDITVTESPIWLQIRLMKAGIRPVNNIVDVTNYYLLKYGQPMHAFDYDALPSKDIHVAYAQEGDKFTTLDGTERLLTGQDVMIKAGQTPVALAGVMGGLDSEVTAATKNVLLETAVFNPVNVRRSSKRFGLRSESSARFEKGINHGTVSESGDQAAQLMAILGSGTVVSGLKEFNQLKVEPVKVTVANTALVNKIGIDLSQEQIQAIIDRLGFQVEFLENVFEVTVPARRWDISIEADILEEIARIYGYDNIPMSLPQSVNIGKRTHKQSLIRSTHDICESMGLNQVISYALTSPEHAQLLKSDDHEFVALDLPMSEDRAILRQSLFPALMEIAQYNQARQNKDLAFYEQGRVFLGRGQKEQPIESEHLAMLLSGEKSSATWYEEATNYDFYDLKGMIEGYFQAIRMDNNLSFKANSEMDIMHPGRTADIYLGNDSVGFMGQIHPNMAKEFDLSLDTYYGELDFDFIVNQEREELVQSPVPKYPSTSRDLALLVKEDQSHQSLLEIIKGNGGEDLVSVALFDYYDGDKIEDGKKSLAYHLIFQNPDRTLEDKDIDAHMQAISQALLAVDQLQIR